MRATNASWLIAGAWLMAFPTIGFGGAPDEEAKDRPRTDPSLMPYYTGQVYPTPRQATYQDSFFLLSKAGILVGKDVESPEPLVRVLVDRIKTYGGAAETTRTGEGDFTTLISLGQTEIAAKVKAPSVPDRAQAYVLASGQADGKNVVVLKGHDRQGLLWAVSSFNQLVHTAGGRLQVRRAEISDYPMALRRGYLHGNVGTFDGGITPRVSQRYNVFLKFNTPVYKHLCRNYYNMKNKPGEWRDLSKHQTEAKHIKEIGELLTPLGIEWSGGLHPVVGPDNQKLNGSPEDIELMAKIARPVLAAGGQFYIQCDDYRFYLHPYDKEKFGTAREADYHILSELDKKLRAEFPKAKIMFVGPFYWGPEGETPEWYGEPIEPYLKKLGELPPSIEIQWTGPRVKSAVVKKEHVEWVTRLIRRKPVYWQNCWNTAHPGYEHYVAEPLECWREWYYDGFLQDIECHTYNCSFPAAMTLVATIADYCWNPKAYDPRRSAEEATKKLFGPRCYEALEGLARELSYYDQFGYNVSPIAAKSLNDLTAHLKEVNRLWDLANTQSEALGAFSSLGAAVRRANDFVEKVKANRGLADASALVEEIRRDAVSETKLNEKRDLFLSPYEFLGGLGPRAYSSKCPKRVALWMYGAESNLNAAKLKFPINPFPAASDYEFILSGQDDDLEKPCGIRVSLNGKVLFEGGSPFVRNGWSQHTFKLPAADLKAENQLEVEVTSPGFRGQPPWFMINYAVVRPGK